MIAWLMHEIDGNLNPWSDRGNVEGVDQFHDLVKSHRQIVDFCMQKV